ncbi:hypothetical protein Tco_0303015, partial [Tanacetum coccineum]
FFSSSKSSSSPSSLERSNDVPSQTLTLRSPDLLLILFTVMFAARFVVKRLDGGSQDTVKEFQDYPGSVHGAYHTGQMAVEDCRMRVLERYGEVDLFQPVMGEDTPASIPLLICRF